MSKGNTSENDYLKLVYNATPIANVADNASVSPLTNLYLALHTADPGEAGDQTTSEASFTNYVRKAVARTSGGWTVTTNQVTNAADVAFDEAGAGAAQTVTHWSCGVASGGASKILHRGVIGTDKGVGVGATDDSITCPGHGLAENDRVIFHAVPGSTIPTGLTEGTAYHVRAGATTDTFTVSATAGGAAVDITAAGAMRVFRATPVVVSEGVVVKFAAGALVILED